MYGGPLATRSGVELSRRPQVGADGKIILGLRTRLHPVTPKIAFEHLPPTANEAGISQRRDQ